MNNTSSKQKKKRWETPAFKKIMIFFECTSYAGAK